MLRKFAFIVLLLPTVAKAQDSNTECSRDALGNVHCTTQTQPNFNAQPVDYARIMQQGAQTVQQPAHSVPDWAAIGAANAAYKERKKQEKIAKAVNAAISSDAATAEPPPSDEKPILLTCTVNGNYEGTLALYEKHNRVDATTNDGVTKTRKATFSAVAVSWVSPLWRSSLSRLNGSYVGYSNVPEMEGQSVNGTCSVAVQRQF